MVMGLVGIGGDEDEEYLCRIADSAGFCNKPLP